MESQPIRSFVHLANRPPTTCCIRYRSHNTIWLEELRLGGAGHRHTLHGSTCHLAFVLMVKFCNISSLGGGMRSNECHSTLQFIQVQHSMRPCFERYGDIFLRLRSMLSAAIVLVTKTSAAVYQVLRRHEHWARVYAYQISYGAERVSWAVWPHAGRLDNTFTSFSKTASMRWRMTVR